MVVVQRAPCESRQVAVAFAQTGAFLIRPVVKADCKC